MHSWWARRWRTPTLPKMLARERDQRYLSSLRTICWSSMGQLFFIPGYSCVWIVETCCVGNQFQLANWLYAVGRAAIFGSKPASSFVTLFWSHKPQLYVVLNVLLMAHIATTCRFAQCFSAPSWITCCRTLPKWPAVSFCVGRWQIPHLCCSVPGGYLSARKTISNARYSCPNAFSSTTRFITIFNPQILEQHGQADLLFNKHRNGFITVWTASFFSHSTNRRVTVSRWQTAFYGKSFRNFFGFKPIILGNLSVRI